MIEPHVTVGGEPPAAPPPTPDPPKRWLAVGAIGVAVGLLFGLGIRGGTDPTGTGSELDPDIEPPPAITTTTVTTRPQADRLATRVPGFIDDLVASYSTTVGSTGVSVWRAAARSPVDASLPAGEYLTDPFHSWLATIATSRYSPGDILWVGNQVYMEPVATGAVGAVWHSQRPGRLTWTETASEEGPVLFTASFAAGQRTVPNQVATLLTSPTVKPVWWTTVGITVFDESLGLLFLLDDVTGETLAETAADAFVAATDAFALVVVDGHQWLMGPRLDPIRTLTIAPSCRSGAFAPIGTLGGPFVALVCDRAQPTQSLQVWSVGFDFEVPLKDVIGTGLVEPAWTPDGTIVVLGTIDPVRPSTRLTFYAPGIDRTYELDFPGRIFWLQVATTR